MYDWLGGRRFRNALARAKKMRRSEELAPSSISRLPLSWRSLYDMINPDGDYNIFPFLEVMRGLRLSRKPLFRHVRGIRKPAIAIYGDRDEFCFGDVSRCVRILADAVGPKPNFELVVVKNADHAFSGMERELGRLMAEWLS
jgi:pimeloyl-ACP methyl ester carboxylesterase